MQKEDARLLLDLALELRLRVRLQLHRINAQEFPQTEFSYRDREADTMETVTVEV